MTLILRAPGCVPPYCRLDVEPGRSSPRVTWCPGDHDGPAFLAWLACLARLPWPWRQLKLGL